MKTNKIKMMAAMITMVAASIGTAWAGFPPPQGSPSKMYVVNQATPAIFWQGDADSDASCSNPLAEGSCMMYYRENNTATVKFINGGNPSNYCTVTYTGTWYVSKVSTTGVGIVCAQQGTDNVVITG